LKAMSNQPDIVLMDVNLEGGREGIEAARWLREVCDIPIVFVTAYSDRVTLQRIHEQVPGAPVIAKPLYRERLARAIAKALVADGK
jgi:CheY-like chemotaxis protein